MVGQTGPVVLHRTLVEGLTIDAMVLADEIETYFGSEEQELALLQMDSARQALVARLGLKLATRINRLVEWLVRRDDDTPATFEIAASGERLCSLEEASLLPPSARALAEAATQLFARVAQLSGPEGGVVAVSSPARALQDSLADRLGLSLGQPDR